VKHEQFQKTTIFGDCKHFFKNAYNLIGLRETKKLAVDASKLD
jgi:hypothetical protein